MRVRSKKSFNLLQFFAHCHGFVTLLVCNCHSLLTQRYLATPLLMICRAQGRLSVANSIQLTEYFQLSRSGNERNLALVKTQ